MVPLHSRHLAGLPPSMSPPPLGERTGHSRWTYSHFESHTMGDHESKIPYHPTSPRPLWEDEPSSTYGTPSGSGRHLIGPSHEYISHYIDHTHTHRRYWLLGYETHHELTSTSTIMYSMPVFLRLA